VFDDSGCLDFVELHGGFFFQLDLYLLYFCIFFFHIFFNKYNERREQTSRIGDRFDDICDINFFIFLIIFKE
jgi:hypothetical protein